MPDVEASLLLFRTVEGQKRYLDLLETAGRELLATLHDRQLSGPVPTSNNAAIPARPDHKYRQAVKIILHSLAYIASWPLIAQGDTTRRQDYVAIPLAKDAFSPSGSYPHLSYSAFRRVFEAIKTVEVDGVPWIEVRKGFYDRASNRSGRTRIRANRPLLDWMTAQGLIFPWHPRGPQRNQRCSGSLLRLRLDDEAETVVPLDRDLNTEEAVLPALNDALARQRLACRFASYTQYERAFDFGRAKPSFAPGGNQRLHRQFVGKDGLGGRLSGHWVQPMPRELRHDGLTINGRPSAELDYGSMQLVLLYVLADVPVPVNTDLYQMPCMEGRRDDMKMVLTLSVGNRTRAEAVSAIGGKLYDENRPGKGKAARLYDAFWQHHAAVNPHCTGSTEPAWPQLQNLESRIALHVLAQLLDQKIAAIPIHDSFVVQERHRDRLEVAMRAAFAAYCPGVPIRVR